jgi:hypothetical protein
MRTEVFNENWSEQTQCKNGTEDKIIILEVEMCASWLKTAIEVRPDTIQEQRCLAATQAKNMSTMAIVVTSGGHQRE